jgi:hypothetical protein
MVAGPSTTTANSVPQWSSVLRTLVDGLVVGTGANNLVQMTAATKLPAVDGSLLTNLPAGTAGTQADQESASSTLVYVSPGRQQYHPSSCKAWGKCTQSGTMTLNAGYNVSSVTDSGVGWTVWNYTVAFSSASYGVSTGTENTLAQYDRTVISTMATSSVTQFSLNNANTLQDGVIYFSAFGDQ